MKRLLALFSFGLFLAPVSGYCGFLVEPLLGYASLESSGTAKVSGVSGNVSEDTATGLVYGGRLGLTFGPMEVGGEYVGGTLDNDGEDLKVTNVGAFVGVDLGLIRLLGSYILSSTAKGDTSVGNVEFKGSGIKAGVGFSFLPFVDVNAEYMMLNYDDENSSVLSDLDMDEKGFMLSLSLPLNL